MAEYLRKPYGKIWANTGENIAPVDTKIDTGWIQEMMPYQWENWLTNRQDEALSYYFQKGIPEYNISEEYIANKSIVTYNGNVYIATSTVTGVLPTTTTSWRRISPTTDVNGIVSITGGGTGATSASAARTALGIGTLGTQASTNVAITGGNINGVTIGGTTPANGTFNSLTGQTVTATTQFTGPGLGLTSVPASSLVGVIADANLSGTYTGVSITGNAATATTLATARTLTIGSTGKSFNGSANVSWSLAEIGAAATNHTHAVATPSVAGFMSAQDKAKLDTIQENAGADWTATLIAANTDLNTIQTEGAYYVAANSVASTLLNCPVSEAFSLRVWRTAGVIQEITDYKSTSGRKTYQRAFYNTWSPWIRVYTEIDPPTSVSGNAETATALQTARLIGGVSFDGTANINLPGVNTAGNQNTTGNAATATTLATARTINGTSFNGAANITTANWGTARTLTIGSTGKSVNGSANISWTLAEIGAQPTLPAGTNGQVLKHNGTDWVAGTDLNTTYAAMSQSEADTGTATTGRIITAAVLKGAILTHTPANAAATTTSAGIVELATGAEAAAGTDAVRAITPSTLRSGLNATGSAPMFACRAWVNFTGAGTVSIFAGGNVSSVTDNGVGNFTINFTTPMVDDNYIYSFGTESAGTSAAYRNTSDVKTASALQLRFYTVGGGLADVPGAHVAIFR